MSDLSRIPVLVPPDIEDSCDLPMGMLDSACNHLKCDVVDAVRGEVPGMKYAAMAELCFQWAKLTGQPKPDRQTYRDYRIDEIAHALGLDRVREPDPTQSGDSPDAPNASQSPATSAVSQATSTESPAMTTT